MFRVSEREAMKTAAEISDAAAQKPLLQNANKRPRGLVSRRVADFFGAMAGLTERGNFVDHRLDAAARNFRSRNHRDGFGAIC